MDIMDIQKMSADELLDNYTEVVRKNNLDPDDIDSDRVLYQMYRIEILNRFACHTNYCM